uniref:Glutamate receptor, ionotropic, delta 2 (Grid2) interacting protein, b n=1 Tax=Maylandia zebra TaxID=106582 RepID=A0A3P9BK25_9CICH
MPTSNQGWPEDFGFHLGGAGPSYILSVEEGSSAHLAGLQAGDQVLEIEGHNVSTLGPQAVIAIAQTQKNIPPSIGVVSRIQQMDITPGPDGRFGFTIVGDCPLLVEDCSPCSPAGRAGLRAGDYVMEVNGIPVRQHEMAAALIKASQGRTLRLGVLCLGPRHKWSISIEDSQMGGEGARLDRKHKALEFNRKQVDQILGDDPEVKERLFAVLKQYAAEKKVEWLASVLPDILTTDEHRQLISSIIFIPKKHRQRFDDTVSQNVINRLCRSKSISEPHGRIRRSRSEDHSDRHRGSKRASSVPRDGGEPGGRGDAERDRGLRKSVSGIPVHPPIGPNQIIRVYRGKKNFGFTLRGHAPVCIDSVIPDSPAEECGLKTGDRILFLNGLDMNCSHEKVVSMLQGSGAVPTLVVEEGPSDFSSDQTDADESSSLAPTTLPRSNVDTLIVDVFPVLDTPAKQLIWKFIYQLLTYDEQERCQGKLSRFLGYKSNLLEPDNGPEHHRRSSSMRVTGSSYRNNVRERSSDDCIIGTHLGMHIDESGSPEERQSGDGTSFPESPDLNHMTGVYTELENVYAGKSVPPLQNRKSGLSLSWKEPLPTPVYEIHHQSSIDSNPYVSLESPPASPHHSDSGHNVLTHRKKLFTFSRPPRSRDTDKFLDSLSEQLGHRVTLVDDFVPGENDYEEMSFQEDQEIGFMPRQLSSGSEDHSSSDEASSPCYSSGSEPIPPPPTQSPPPPPPLQALIPPPIPFTDPLPPVRFSPEHVPRSRMPFQPHHPIIPPPPPPPRTILSCRSPLHKKHPSRDENEKTLQRFQPTTRLGHTTLTSTKTLRSRPTYLPRQFSQPQPIRQPSPQPSPQLLRPSQLLGEDSEYDKLTDMVKHLDLDLHFGTQRRSPAFQPENLKKKDVVEILSHKKAYNAILIAHLKISPEELRQVLMNMTTDRLEPAHIKQLLLYAPDEEEVKQYEQFDQDPGKLSEPDQFIFQMLMVPDYKTRLRSLYFKTTLQERTEEMKIAYDYIYKASVELRSSKKLAKILEQFVLAMGNYLNNGQPKSNRTTSFKINFLTELSTTKTVDGKSTFLHILAKSLCQHFPELLSFPRDLTTVPLAAKNQRAITTELSDLHSTVQDIRAACQKIQSTPDDHFTSVMSTFLENSHPAIQSLESLQTRAMEEFSKVASYFGEDSKSSSTETFFGIFSEFVSKFERALSEIQTPENPRSPRLSSPLAW